MIVQMVFGIFPPSFRWTSLIKFYSYNSNVVPVHACYNEIYTIESNLHKQQCIIGLVARTRKYSTLLKFKCIVCLKALMNVGYAHTI